MNRIEAFVEKVFEGIQMDDQLSAQKEELILNMCDSYEDKIAGGLDEEEAFEAVVRNFGSVKELREAFELEDEKTSGISVKKIAGYVGIALLILGIALTSRYISNRREYLVKDFNDLTYIASRIVFDAKDSNFAHDESLIESSNVYKMLNVNVSNLKRDMNAIEQKRLSESDNGMFLSYNVIRMYWKLVARQRNGYWDVLDDTVYERFVGYSEELLQMANEESFYVTGRVEESDSNAFKALFHIVDIEGISNQLKKLNELASAYVTYTTLPEEMTCMTPEEVEEDLRERFGDEILEVEISDNRVKNLLAWDCLYTDIVIRTSTSHGRVDYNAYFGTIEGIDARVLVEEEGMNDGVTLDAVWAERTLQHYLSQDAEYEIRDKGLNYKIHDSRRDYQVYEFIPYYGGYPIYFGGMAPLLQVEVGNENNLSIVPVYFPKSNEQIGTVEENYSYEEALVYAFENERGIIEARNGSGVTVDDFEYVETGLDLSYLSGKYDLMHVYEFKENGRVLRIHASDGVVDLYH